MCPTCVSPTAAGEAGGGGGVQRVPVSWRAHGSVWVLIKRVLVMNELVRRVCMTIELPNYGFELITLSPLHAISMCQGGQSSRWAAPCPTPAPTKGAAWPQPCPSLARVPRAQGLGIVVPEKAAGGGSPSPGTTYDCLGATSPGTQCWAPFPGHPWRRSPLGHMAYTEPCSLPAPGAH